MYNYDTAIGYLAETLADPDDWDFSDSTKKSYIILRNYLEHTFRKIKEEDKLFFTTDNEYACFNTGLTTRNLEEIFCVFSKNRDASKAPYFFKSFSKKSDQFLTIAFKGALPQIADYFNRPGDLIFNPNCQIIPDIDHIIEENLERFPKEMQGLGNAEIRRRLEGSIEEIKKKVKTNYKLAVPQYFQGRIQLLLPLCLTPGSPNPDLALVTHKINDDTYSARTCLTLKMAYNNARLIVKPQSSWLKP